MVRNLTGTRDISFLVGRQIWDSVVDIAIKLTGLTVHGSKPDREKKYFFSPKRPASYSMGTKVLAQG
jgi:hypothetical protein